MRPLAPCGLPLHMKAERSGLYLQGQAATARYFRATVAAAPLSVRSQHGERSEPCRPRGQPRGTLGAIYAPITASSVRRAHCEYPDQPGNRLDDLGILYGRRADK